MDLYDRNRDNNIDRTETVPMLVDVYRTFNKQFNPNTQDIDSYFKVFDRNRDGRISINDVEDLCIRYLVGGDSTSINDNGSNMHSMNIQFESRMPQ